MHVILTAIGLSSPRLESRIESLVLMWSSLVPFEIEPEPCRSPVTFESSPSLIVVELSSTCS